VGKTSIEWTDASWNPIVGCTEVSPGCANCYAARLAATRLSGVPAYKDLAILNGGKPRWLGNVAFLAERLEEPLRWRKPRRIFVCDMGDLFHESVLSTWLVEIFEVILECPQHTFQILTKRAAWMRDFFRTMAPKPLPNVWLGVSVENQRFADERIPSLLETPAAVRFISAEPLLGPINLDTPVRKVIPAPWPAASGLDWVIAGGESGPHARPMHPEWPRSLRDQCQAAGVPFFFKQWGQFAPLHPTDSDHRTFAGVNVGNGQLMLRYGKKLSGRLLDGKEHNAFPVPAS
jgi:protein gp37